MSAYTLMNSSLCCVITVFIRYYVTPIYHALILFYFFCFTGISIWLILLLNN